MARPSLAPKIPARPRPRRREANLVLYVALALDTLERKLDSLAAELVALPVGLAELTTAVEEEILESRSLTAPACELFDKLREEVVVVRRAVAPNHCAEVGGRQRLRAMG